MPEKSDFKPKPKGTPRGSRTEKIYAAGLIPAEHQKLLNGFRTALDGETKGELIFQKVLDLVGISRASALKMIKLLEKYKYLKYEANPREHKIYVELLKAKETI